MSYGAVKLSLYLCYVIFWSNSRQDEYHNMPETFTVKVTHLDIYCSLSLYCTLFYFILFFIWPGKFFLQHFSGWLIFVWRSLNFKTFYLFILTTLLKNSFSILHTKSSINNGTRDTLGPQKKKKELLHVATVLCKSQMWHPFFTWQLKWTNVTYSHSSDFRDSSLKWKALRRQCGQQKY